MTTASGRRHDIDVRQLEIRDVMMELSALLPSSLIASLAGVKDPSQVRKWARGELEPTIPAASKLRFALMQARDIEAAQSSRVAQAWLTTANKMLAYDLPIKAIREERYAETAAAATSFIEGGYQG